MIKQRADLRRRLIASLERRREIVFACLHGSFLDEALPYHDVDVAIYLNPTWRSEQGIFEYEMALSVDLTRALHVPVDVHVLNEAPSVSSTAFSIEGKCSSSETQMVTSV